MREILTPIAGFNKILQQLTNQLETIYFDSVCNNTEFRNSMLFQNTSIVLFGFVKLEIEPIKNSETLTKFSYSFVGKLTADNIPVIQKTISSLGKLRHITYQYYTVVSQTTPDLCVTQEYLNSLYTQIITQALDGELVPLPIKNKLDERFANRILANNSYYVKFIKKSDNIQYTIIQKENHDSTIDGKFLDLSSVTMLSGTVLEISLAVFLSNLFYYGRTPHDNNILNQN